MATSTTKAQAFTEEEMSIDQSLGYPKAYSKLCSSTRPFNYGPPLSFLPSPLQPQEALRAKDLNQLFPITDPDALPSPNPRGYVNLLWKQLDHLGNAGFDPGLFRVDPYGNVLYLHADSASPLAWDIDHWFPCSRGGRTVPSNLRLLQWQVCKKKKNKLESLVPWWDLQLGISVNQFLSIFASKNSDFRKRAFGFLFQDGGSEELNAVQAVESHSFPQHFFDLKRKLGLAPAAIVSSSSSILKPLDVNKSTRHHNSSPFPGMNTAIQRYRHNVSKENEAPESDDFSVNPYLSITRARDALRQREENKKKEAEMSQLDDEVNELRQKNETDRIAIQDLEALLIKRRRRAEKCRRLAEAQSSYKTLLEKMIRDAMHQSVVYKEQLRLNQSATSALMARLEAQRAACDSSESELRRKFNQRDAIEKEIARPCWEEQARKRSRMDYTLFEERNEDCIKAWTTPMKKELRAFLEEEQKASEATGLEEEEEDEYLANDKELKFREGSCTSRPKTRHEEKLVSEKLAKLTIREDGDERREEEEHRNEAGKGNVEKWLQMMLENAKEGSTESEPNVIKALEENEVMRNGEKEIKYLKLKPLVEGRRSLNNNGGCEQSWRGFRSVPSSPTMRLRSVDCIGKKPKVMGDEDDEGDLDSVAAGSSKFIKKTCTRTIKRSVNK